MASFQHSHGGGKIYDQVLVVVESLDGKGGHCGDDFLGRLFVEEYSHLSGERLTDLIEDRLSIRTHSGEALVRIAEPPNDHFQAINQRPVNIEQDGLEIG